MEAGELALYLFFVCTFVTVLQHPASPVRQMIGSAFLRQALMGLAMGTITIAILLTPLGKQSGGHFNPAITLTYYRLGKVERWDAVFYVAAQFIGAISGIVIARCVLGGRLRDSTVRCAVTAPGRFGGVAAFLAELTISFILMITILLATNAATLGRYTPYFVGLLLMMYYAFESPLSGMSTNPARSFGSALHARQWHAMWIYFTAPLLGMLLAAEVFLRARGGVGPYCAKLHHDNNTRCIFNHGYQAKSAPAVVEGECE
jgi:aquaporin Z